MPATHDANGLTIQTFEEIEAEVGADLEGEGFRSDLESSFGQLKRIWSELEATTQEAILAAYNTLSFYTDGAHLDRVVQSLGVERRPAQSSRVIGTAGGTAGTVIPDGTRIRYNPDETIWTVEGPRVLDGSGALTDLAVVAEDEGEDHRVALDPDSGFDDWTILDSVIGFDSFESTAQPIVGAPVESDDGLRARAKVEAYRKGQGPLPAVRAAVTAVEGVTAVRVYENTGTITDVNGLPGKSIRVVVDGGEDQEVAEAIAASRPASAELVGAVAVTLEDGDVMNFDRIEPVEVWVRVTLTTSTSEEQAPADVEDLAKGVLVEAVADLFGIGDDVIPGKLAHAVWHEQFGGIDAVAVELSLDDGGSPAGYGTAKIPIGATARAAFDAGRIEVTTD